MLFLLASWSPVGSVSSQSYVPHASYSYSYYSYYSESDYFANTVLIYYFCVKQS